jgi:hypothetical protein
MRFCPATAEENANISNQLAIQAIQAEAHISTLCILAVNSDNNEIGMHQLAVVEAFPWETRPSQELKRTVKTGPQTRLRTTVPTTKGKTRKILKKKRALVRPLAVLSSSRRRHHPTLQTLATGFRDLQETTYFYLKILTLSLEKCALPSQNTPCQIRMPTWTLRLLKNTS